LPKVVDLRPDVHGDIKNFSRNGLNQLGLGTRPLKMQPPQGIFDRKGEVVLHKESVYANGAVTLLMMRFQKVSPFVAGKPPDR
jgi:hypothetical protein